MPLITEKIDYHSPEIQYLKDRHNGYLVDDGDIEGLASNIIELLNDPNKLKKMSQNAINTVKKEANVQLMIERMGIALGLKKNYK